MFLRHWSQLNQYEFVKVFIQFKVKASEQDLNNWRAESIAVLCWILGGFIFSSKQLQFLRGAFSPFTELCLKFFEGPMHKLKQFGAQN